MTLALSLILVAVGAVLIWGLDYEVAGLNIDVIGVIGIVVGLAGIVFSLLAYARGDRTVERRDYIVDR